MLKALLIDDDAKLAKLLTEFLETFEIGLVSTIDPTTSLGMIRAHQPDIIILDVMMPKMDGFEVCRNIRKKFSTPIIMLSARGESLDQIRGLDLGADDYISKPFEPRELVARIHSLFRRLNKQDGDYERDEFQVFSSQREIHLNGHSLDLTNMEFELLNLFLISISICFNISKKTLLSFLLTLSKLYNNDKVLEFLKFFLIFIIILYG